MEGSEIALGFKQGSRTLSHHLRGMCLKALHDSDWDVGRAASLIAGDNDGATRALVRRKIERYREGIMTKSEVANQKSLFTNLPKAYHEFLHQAIVYYQNGLRPEKADRRSLHTASPLSHTMVGIVGVVRGKKRFQNLTHYPLIAFY